MERGFYLIDGLLASFILLVSIQGTLLLSRKTGNMATVNSERAAACMLLNRLTLIPVGELDFLEKNYTIHGDDTDDAGFFHVCLEVDSTHGFGQYQITLTYTDRMGEFVGMRAVRWEVIHE
jgi:hypothetical protein